MSIDVVCVCGRTYTFRDEFAGRQATCPDCGARVTVPGGAFAEAAPEVAAPGRAPPAHRDKVAFAVAILGLAALVVALIVVFWTGWGARPWDADAPDPPAAAPDG